MNAHLTGRRVTIRWRTDTTIPLVWIGCALLVAASVGRTFGTDIDNYIDYLRDIDSVDTRTSIEPLYILATQLLTFLGFGPTATLDLVAMASLGLIAVYCSRQRHPVATLVIVLGWVLLQQVWGTVRTGLGICVLLVLNDAYFRTGRLRLSTWTTPIYHWSLVVHPISLLLRLGPIQAALIAVATYGTVLLVGSVRDLFFAIVPPAIEALANYAALQTGETATHPSPVPLLIHLILVFAISAVCKKDEARRLLGPLTLLYCATCLFFDFEQAGSRAANVLLSVKLIALVRIYDHAGKLPGGSLLIRGAVLAYSTAVGLQYYLTQIEYFRL